MARPDQSLGVRMRDPVWFFTHVLGVSYLTPDQVRIAESFRDNKRTAVPSGHGVGKTFLSAALVLWFLVTNYRSRVITTAPTWFQVENLLWREIAGLWSAAKYPLGGTCNKTSLEFDEKWVAIGISTTEATRFQGTHAPRVAVLFDEATGVPPFIWDAAESLAVGPGDRLFAVGNPTDPSSRFKAVCDSGNWHVIELSSEAHPNVVEGRSLIPGAVTREWCEERLKDYGGRETPLYRSRVLGKWPEQGDDTLISLAWVDAAVTRWVEPTGYPRATGTDVARFGCFDDQTEILTDRGWLLFAQLDGSERVLSLLDGDVAGWAPITQVHRYPFVGEMNLYDGEKLNFCVTDNHKLVAASAGHCKATHEGPVGWALARWDQLPGEFLVRRESTWRGTRPGPFVFTSACRMPYGGERLHVTTVSPEDWFRFLGWFVSEGNVYVEKRVNGRYRVMLTQYPGQKRDRMEALLSTIGFRWRKAGEQQIEFTNRAIGAHLMAECGVGAAAKRVPAYVKEAPPELIECFLETFCLGDGSYRRGRRQSYFTSSRQLANDIQEMLVKIGRAGKLVVVAEAGSVSTINGRTIIRTADVYTVTEVARPRPGYVVKAKAARVKYSGEVFCVSTPKKTIMVRRNGCAMWSGNSDETVAILIYEGGTVGCPIVRQGQDTMGTAGMIRSFGCVANAVDDTGLGGGVTDRLAELGHPITPENFGESARDDSRFFNRRSELWWNIREALQAGTMALPEDRRLMADLTNVKYSLDSSGRIKLEPKPDIKKRLGRSPDRGDALAIAWSAYSEGRALDTLTLPSGLRSGIGATF